VAIKARHDGLKLLLLTFPHLKSETGPVMHRLLAANADEAAIAEWKNLAASDILPANEDDEFGGE
jgi:hypothetical protein